MEIAAARCARLAMAAPGWLIPLAMTARDRRCETGDFILWL
jgi:hypothetical protein